MQVFMEGSEKDFDAILLDAMCCGRIAFQVYLTRAAEDVLEEGENLEL